MRANRILTGIIVVLAIIGIFFVILWKGFGLFQGKGENNADPSVSASDDDVDLSANDVQRILGSLKVDLSEVDLSGYMPDVNWIFSNLSLPIRASERTAASGFSDAVSMPFVHNKSGANGYIELKAELLQNPVLGLMAAKGLSEVEVVKGHTLTEVNPWLADFAALEAGGLEQFLTYRGNAVGWGYVSATQDLGAGTDYARNQDGTATIFVTRDYRLYATYTCYLLDLMINEGYCKDGQYTSYLNYCLNGAAIANDVRTVKAAYQETKAALVLKFIDKSGKTRIIIGFNKWDKRFELLKTPDKPKNPPATTPGNPPAETNPPTVITNPPPTVTTVPVTNPPPTETTKLTNPPPVVTTRKNPADDPVNKGNAPVGGGQNKPGDGSGDLQPTDPVKDSSGGHQNPANVTPTAPSVATSPSQKPVVSVDENPMDYQPDNKDQDTNWNYGGQTYPNAGSSGGNNNNNSGGSNSGSGATQNPLPPAGEFREPQ